MSDFIPYRKARKLLESRLGATAEEIAAWVFMGPVPMAESCRNKDFCQEEQARLHTFRYWPCLPLEGLDAYSNAKEFDDPPRFHFDWEIHGNDYLGPLESCWFRAEDIAAFQPLSLYITGQALKERWLELGDRFNDFIVERIKELVLLDFYPTGVETQWSCKRSDAPAKEFALFVLAHIEAIEAEHGIDPVRMVEAPPAPEQATDKKKPGRKPGNHKEELRLILDALAAWAGENGRVFDPQAMPGPLGEKADDEGSFHWLCAKMYPHDFMKSKRAFEEHRAGVCAIAAYTPATDFYRQALPHIAQKLGSALNPSRLPTKARKTA